jgi:hypothetical protein
MGCAYFKGHHHDGKDFTGRAWWGVPDNGIVKPFVDEEAHELAEKLGFQRRDKANKGASILVVGCGKLDMIEIRKAFELYWWPSIVDQTFDIELIDDGTPIDPPQPKQNSSVRPLRRTNSFSVSSSRSSRSPQRRRSRAVSPTPRRVFGRQPSSTVTYSMVTMSYWTASP